MLTKDAEGTARAIVDSPAPLETTTPAGKLSRKITAVHSKQLQIYIDGKFYSEANAKISVFDHGLLYGDGIFEGIRFYNGRVFRLEEHLERLWDSARSICLEIPMSMNEMTEALLETIRQNELRDGYIRLMVTRGMALAIAASARHITVSSSSVVRFSRRPSRPVRCAGLRD